MKLNYKRTIFVGFAFFLICTFWGAYDASVQMTLANKYGLNDLQSGIVMALDNIFALFLLPLFGSISDKTKSKWGRRTPFIIFGTLGAVVAFSLMGFTNSLVSYMICLLFALLSMSVFRSPAVALMPDVTVKPLRSKGNAIINLMGTAGGALAMIIGIFFKTSEKGQTEYGTYILVICAVILAALVGFIFTVKEPTWSAEMEEETERLGLDEEAEERDAAGGKLSKGQLKSLILILASVALWYMAYNAVTSKIYVYAANYLEKNYNVVGLIAQVAALISFIPVGIIASKIGRKKTILAGVVLLFSAFLGASFVTKETNSIILTILFIVAGIGWATINVNSFPMVVELAKGSDVGKYTGYYYTASMAAQIITPIFAGWLMKEIAPVVMFPYAAVFSAFAFVTMLFVKHGDSKPEEKKGLEALDVDD